ncbi:UNVERIFIED_CONTAM: Piezo-type mechanosensitive ion channel [Sesamum radiatum]|uniref:Piezo-type mechanosensitive ion channel n=1 Tax=Sesamum radiatum TaxID=300843 RepID=A0AAW2WBM4_SESRA
MRGSVEPLITFMRSARAETPFALDFTKHPVDASISEITELGEDASDYAINDSDKVKKGKTHSKENPLASAVQLIGDGVSQVQSIGNQAVSNLVSFLNIAPEDSDSNEPSALEDGFSNEKRIPDIKQTHLSSSSSLQSDKSRNPSSASLQIGRIVRHIWSQMRSNNDVVCYCCFVLVFLWNFSLLSMVYLAALFLGFTHRVEVHSGSSWSEKAKKVFQLIKQVVGLVVSSCSRYWKSLTQEAESPPYFVQLSMDVKVWPEDGIQPERIESGINQLLQLVHDENCNGLCCFSTDCRPSEQFKSLTPAADVAKEILRAQHRGLAEVVGFPYPILSIIFFLIVVDRIIYLCSFATGKVIFYLFNLILFTYASTEYAWNMDTSQQNTAGLALRAIYLTKAISLALQAMQIRYGVPHRSTLYRQFLTSEVSRVNYLGYRLYRALPFLYELRCVLDWSCTTTSLTMYDWLKLEDINASLYLVKCDNVLNRASHKQGEKQTKMTKFCNGICLFFILMCVIWAPMLMYSSGNPTNIANPINDASFQLDIKTNGGRLTLYQTTLCERIAWDNVNADADLDPQHYLDSYNVKDIQLICCQADASSLWLVPDVVQKQFIRSLNSSSMDIKFSWVNDVSADIVLHHGIREWWSFHDINSLDAYGCGALSGPMAVIVSEETPQGFLGETLSKFSIWGLYITFVLAVGRFIRMQCSDLRMRIPYENLPSCDRLIAICEDIYAARAEGELGVEEVLYWTLVKIYRSPHMLLEYTNPD